MKIAAGAAKGLAFLHEAEKQVIYRDFKASNILLDSVSITFSPLCTVQLESPLSNYQKKKKESPLSNN